ncbi:MAG: ABC transporter ATP-binding protein [Pseudobdellovibrio sp.]
MENVVEIKNVFKSYQLGSTEVHALRGLSLKIKKGEFAALIGASGSGKTTLLNLVGCLDDADRGEILIENVSVKDLSENQKSELRNQKIGFIFQSFNLIPVLNIYENVEIPLTIRTEMSPEDRKTKVLNALKDVGLEEYVHHRPDQLSGGQRQRVAIARALVTEPSLILADEPTANLDSKTAHHIIDLMLELNKKRHMTFFFCTHDEKLMSRVQRIVKISDGVIES